MSYKGKTKGLYMSKLSRYRIDSEAVCKCWPVVLGLLSYVCIIISWQLARVCLTLVYKSINLSLALLKVD